MRPELTFRSRKILYAVVTEYIATGEPVGSRRIARRYGLNLSPASIRNVLSDLEEAGFLSQPHTSAGRVPTDLGFRVFVDALVQMREVTSEERAAVATRMRQLRPGQDDIMRETGRLLASLTNAVAIVTAPRPDADSLAQLRYLPLRPGQLLAVLVTRAGAVQNRAVAVEEDLTAAELEQVNNYLAEFVSGRSLADLRGELAERMASERDQYDRLRKRARDVIEATVERGEGETSLVIEGRTQLFDRPEFADAEKIRGYLRAFEATESLVTLLDKTLAAGGVHVVIGSEANLTDVKDISVISANYGKSGTPAGAVGIIGPTRMDYGKLVPLVGFTAQTLSEVLEGEEEEGG